MYLNFNVNIKLGSVQISYDA